MLTIVDTCYQFDFYDGTKVIEHCAVGTDYFFGTAESKAICESYVSIEDKFSHKRINIKIFGADSGSTWKYLSDSKLYKNVFDTNDLVKLAEILDVQLFPQPDHTLSSEIELKFMNNSPYDIILLQTLIGGRQPEGVIIYKIVFVTIDTEIKQKIFFL